MTSPPNFDKLACPAPLTNQDCVQMAHGGGGRMSQRLVEGMILPAFDNAELGRLHDGAELKVGGARLAFSTDSYVVRPLFFPGGDIGKLAVHGTVNDLAMCGARPLALSAAFILEEGFPLTELQRVLDSMREAAQAVGVSIVTGDTKVVDRGKGDGLYVNTAGIGLIPAGVTIDPALARPGDVVLLSGAIAAHGVAILSVREGLTLEGPVRSDTAPLHDLVGKLLERFGRDVHVLRDPTRGGVASTLNELAKSARVGIHLREDAIPVQEAVRGACELFGLDPLYVANEGKALALVAPEIAEAALAQWRAHPEGTEAAIIGQVVAEHPGMVTMQTTLGSNRVVDLLSGEQLPRIC